MPHDKNGNLVRAGQVIKGRSLGSTEGPEYLACVTQVMEYIKTCNAYADVIAERYEGVKSWHPQECRGVMFTCSTVQVIEPGE